MTILEALIQLRDDLKLWCINNFNHKLNKNLGTEENGKFLTVNSSGDIVTTSNYGVRSVSTGSTNGTISVNTNGTSADVAVKGLGSAAYTASTAYDAAGTAQTKADAALASAKAYTDSLIDGLTAEGDANAGVVQAALNAHKEDKNNPHGVTLSQLGVTATAAELNYVDGVTSAIQTQLDAKAASSHNHAASNITSGTLSSDRLPTVPVAKGGTGATTAIGALNNLGIETGTWTPIPLGMEAVMIGGMGLGGYYVKINDIITISFYMHCYVSNSSGADNYFYIDASDLPYAPYLPNDADDSVITAWYAGGGHVQGLYTNESAHPDASFTGWTIYDDKKIYARTSNKSTTNGVTSHDGGYMYAPSSSSEIFASGTITYKIAI